MNLIAALKGLWPTNKNQTSQAKSFENPYISARRHWNSQIRAMAAATSTWQLVALLCLFIVAACVGGLIHIGSQSKFVPYTIEIDKIGQARAVGPIHNAKVDGRVIHREIADFIEDARMVTPDIEVQRNAVFRVYAKLAPNDPATAKMNEWMGGSEDNSPFKRATLEMVSVEIQAAMQQTKDTWQVDWSETTRDRNGTIKSTQQMRALVTYYILDFTSNTSEEEIRKNPVGLYIRDFSWSRVSN